MPEHVLDPIAIENFQSPPDTGRLTTEALDGTGVFDVLMRSVNLHLEREYQRGRITGQNYADLYLGSLQAVLQQAVGFLLNHQSERRTNAEIGLIRQQIVSELARTDDTLKAGLGFNDSTALEGLLALEKAKLQMEEGMVEAQKDSAEAERHLIGQRIVTELSQTGSSLENALAAGYGYNTENTVKGTLEGANRQSIAAADLAEQQVVTELAQTSDTKPAGLGLMAGTDITGMIAIQRAISQSQVEKNARENELIKQKVVTELAQTSDTVPTTDYLNADPVVTGAIGHQNAVYDGQAYGYKRDAEQKAAQVIIDAFTVMAANGAAQGTAANKLDADSIGRMITKLYEGVGIPGN